MISLILSECVSREQEVYSFLLSCINPLTPEQAQAFMDYAFDAQSMFCWIQNGKIEALLQTYRRPLTFLGKKTSAYVIGRGFYNKGYKNRLDELAEAAVGAAEKSSLFILVDTREPSLYRRQGFGKVSTQVESELIEVYDLDRPAMKIQEWNREENPALLYPLYQRFMSFFDGSLMLSEEQFISRTELALESGEKIWLALEQDKPLAFAITRPFAEGIELDTLIYSDPQALISLLSWFSKRHDVIRVRYSKSENLEAIADLEVFPRSSLMMKVCDVSAFNRWQNVQTENFEEIFALLKKPQWNFYF